MRVLMANIRHFPGGGDSTYAFNLAELLRRQGRETAFFAMQGERNIPDPNEDLFVSHVDFRELHREGSLLSGLKAALRCVYSLEAREKFSGLLDRFKPDLVHLQNIHSHITPSIIFEAAKRSLPVLWTLHDYKLVCPNSYSLNDRTGRVCQACGRSAYYRAALKRCKKGSFAASLLAAVESYSHRIMRVRSKVHRFLVPSRFLMENLAGRGMNREKMIHLPYVLPDELFQETPKGGDYILFMGRIEPIKGVRTLVRAAGMVPKVKLVLAGLAVDQESGRLLAGMPENARYVGMKSGDELKELLLGARAVVVPSLWFENQPFSILEAYAAAKPVIASDLGGMRELLHDRDTGVLVRPGEAEDLARAMQRLWDNPAEAARMGRNAREYAKSEHGSAVHYERISSIYNEALASRPKA